MRRTAVAVAVVLASALPACTRSPSNAIRIGSLYPRSGSQAPAGIDEARGADLAAEWANTHGGVRGRPIQLVRWDVRQADGVAKAMRALRRDGVSTVVGSHGSTISAAAAEAAARLDMVFWETGAVGQTDPDVDGGTHFFRVAPMGSNLGREAIAFIRDEMTGRLEPAAPLRYAVAYVDDAYGRAVGAGASAEITRSGLASAGTFAYNPRTTDFGPTATAIGAARPDVLFVSAYLDDAIALRRATIAQGIHLQASIGTSSSYCMPAFGQRLGDAAVGLFASDKPDAADVRADLLRPEANAQLAWARTMFRRRWHAEMSAPALSGFANGLALFVDVLPAAKSLRPSDVAAAAVATKLPEGGLPNAGGLDIAPPGSPDAGANRKPASVIWEWVAPGQRAVVWPPAFASHPVTALPLA